MADEKIGIRPCIILIEDGKVLCIHCKYEDGEYYLFPGGGVEPGETIADSAVREMFEETGLKVEIKKLVYVNDWVKNLNTNERVLNMFFLGKVKGGEIIQVEKDGGKVKKVEWIELNNFNEIDFRPKFISQRLKEDYEKGFPEVPYFN